MGFTGGISRNNSPQYLSSIWRNGYNIGLISNFHIKYGIFFSLEYTYHNYIFDKDEAIKRYELRLADIQTIDEESSSVHQFQIKLGYYIPTPKNYISPFIQASFGIAHFNYSILLVEKPSPISGRSRKSIDSFKDDLERIIGFGGGIITHIYGDINLILSYDYYSNILDENEIHYYSIKVGLLFQLR